MKKIVARMLGVLLTIGVVSLTFLAVGTALGTAKILGFAVVCAWAADWCQENWNG